MIEWNAVLLDIVLDSAPVSPRLFPLEDLMVGVTIARLSVIDINLILFM